MLTYNMDVEERSTWLRATPGAAALAQPFYCTEAGNFYGRAHFATARTDKESYLLFYTLSGSGLIEQNDQRVELPAGSALLLNCRTPQSYCTAPGQDHWHHYWAHLDGDVDALLKRYALEPNKVYAPHDPEILSELFRSRCLSHWPPSGSTVPPHRSRSAWPCTGCWP